MPPVRALAVLAAALLAGSVPAAASAAPVGTPSTLASGLSVPWDVVALPDGRVLVTERSRRRIRVVMPDGTVRPAPAWVEPDAWKVLGLAVHPDYADNRWVYAYVTYGTGSKVVRLVDDGTDLRVDRVVFGGPIATDGNHDGGRIRFGPDGKLYVTTGDAHDPALPRDLSKLNGKILRLEDDGSAPADNPYADRADDGRFVWSSGHRHPQGLAWDATGRLWASEHGPTGESYAPAGERTGNDEVNLVVAGGDYGWPDSSGAVVAPGTRPPAWVGGDQGVAPGGLAFGPDGRLYVPMLVGRHLQVLRPQGDTLTDEGTLYGDGGTRLRAASVLGCTLAFTTDRQVEDSDDVLQVALAPCGPPAGPLPPASPSAPGGDPAPPPALPAAPAGRAPGPHRAGGGGTAGSAAAVDRLLARARAAVAGLQPRGLARRRALAVRAGGFEPGRLEIALRHRPARGRAVTVARARAQVASRRPLAVRLRTTPEGRARLVRAARIRLRLTVSHRPDGGRAIRRSRAVVLGRQGASARSNQAARSVSQTRRPPTASK